MQLARVQAAGGQFWAPMGVHAEYCGWPPAVPVRMFLDSLLSTAHLSQRQGTLATQCLQQLVLSANLAGAFEGACLFTHCSILIAIRDNEAVWDPICCYPGSCIADASPYVKLMFERNVTCLSIRLQTAQRTNDVLHVCAVVTQAEVDEALTQSLKALLWTIPTQLQRAVNTANNADTALLCRARITASQTCAFKMLLALSQEGVAIGQHVALWLPKAQDVLAGAEAGHVMTTASATLAHCMWVCSKILPCTTSAIPFCLQKHGV
jgi:hypothetical protein